MNSTQVVAGSIPLEAVSADGLATLTIQNNVASTTVKGRERRSAFPHANLDHLSVSGNARLFCAVYTETKACGELSQLISLIAWKRGQNRRKSWQQVTGQVAHSRVTDIRWTSRVEVLITLESGETLRMGRQWSTDLFPAPKKVEPAGMPEPGNLSLAS